MEYFDIRTILKKVNREENEVLAEFFDNVIEDLEGRIPKDIADMLIDENNKPDYELRIHRCLADKKEGIFNKGLYIKGGDALYYTTSEYSTSDMSLLLEVNRAHGYKNPRGEDALCVLAKIPKDYLTYKEGKTKPILIPTDRAAEQGGGAATVQNETQTILMPEFILGAIKFSDGKIVGYEPNERYRDEHDYDCTGLRCESSAIQAYCDLHGLYGSIEEAFDDDKQRARMEMVNEIIVNEQIALMKARKEENQIRVEEITVDPEMEREESPKVVTAKDFKEAFLRRMPKSRFMEATKKFGRIFSRDDKTTEKENTGEEK